MGGDSKLNDYYHAVGGRRLDSYAVGTGATGLDYMERGSASPPQEERTTAALQRPSASSRVAEQQNNDAAIASIRRRVQATQLSDQPVARGPTRGSGNFSSRPQRRQDPGARGAMAPPPPPEDEMPDVVVGDKIEVTLRGQWEGQPGRVEKKLAKPGKFGILLDSGKRMALMQGQFDVVRGRGGAGGMARGPARQESPPKQAPPRAAAPEPKEVFPNVFEMVVYMRVARANESAKIRGGAGIHFEYRQDGWKIASILPHPGQPELRPNDVVVGINGTRFRGHTNDEQQQLFKDNYVHGAELLILRRQGRLVREFRERHGYGAGRAGK